MTARRARAGVLPAATPTGWEAEAPTARMPFVHAVPGTLADAAPRAAGRPVLEVAAAVLALLVALVLLSAVLQATGAAGFAGITG
jgi:hypothetical protein